MQNQPTLERPQKSRPTFRGDQESFIFAFAEPKPAAKPLSDRFLFETDE
jgi:hypothetical protein